MENIGIRIFLAACLLLPIPLYGQTARTRYVAWVTPVGNNNVTIDGVAVGLMALPGKEGHLRINGLNIELVPVAIFTLPGSMILTMMNVVVGDSYAEPPTKIRTVIHGLSISGGMFEEVEMHGVSFNINSYSGFSHGVEVSFFMNSNYMFSGVQLSMMGNRAVKGKGFQLGFYNSCDDCRVVQIGFLNRIGHRVLPLINFSLKKRNKVRASSKIVTEKTDEGTL